MKIKVAPFGIGPTDVEVDTEVVKDKVLKASAVVVGYSLVATEGVLRNSSQRAQHIADKLTSMHKGFCDKVIAYRQVQKPFAIKLDGFFASMEEAKARAMHEQVRKAQGNKALA
jgi:hypothetical protein